MKKAAFVLTLASLVSGRPWIQIVEPVFTYILIIVAFVLVIERISSIVRSRTGNAAQTVR
ncbi:MAG TPA: hypothetical protein VME22_14985 [Solirubrobacteraceae bacterium]|nr:hypothetical protein [Solirubrobacteraceae bacterium]